MPMCMCVCAHMRPEIDVRSLPQLFSMLIFEAGFPTEPGTHHLARLASQGAVVIRLSLLPQCQGTCTAMSGYYMGLEDSNSSPCAGTANNFLTKPLPQTPGPAFCLWVLGDSNLGL